MTTYYEKNREKCILQATLYQLEHKEHYKQYQREYFLRNKDILYEKARQRRIQNQAPKERKVRVERPPKPPKEPKKRGRPSKAPGEKKPRYIPRPKRVVVDRSEVVIEPIEEEQPQEIVWVSDRDFVVSFD